MIAVPVSKAIESAERSQLLEHYRNCRSMSTEWLRRQIIENDRIDILATEVLGYEVQPFHLAMMRFQFTHPESLQLAYRGGGKCLDRCSVVMLANGRTTQVENIKIGDQLMGPDGLPRMVLSTAQGTGPMYRVIPKKGDPWICNDAHILTLKGRGHFYGGRIRDFPIEDVIEMGRNYKRGTLDMAWKLFRVPIDFEEQPTTLDPYFFGLWLGDGHTGEPTISNPDIEILNACREFASSIGYECSSTWHSRNNCRKIGIVRPYDGRHWLRRYLKDLGVKKVPEEYIFNSEEKRLQLLAGLLDTDGYYSRQGNHFEIIQKQKQVADSIVYISRSLGLAAYSSIKRVRLESGFEGDYHRVTISGDLDRIPTRVERKKARPRSTAPASKDVLVFGFEIEPVGIGDYYGFELDGDGRFLLGDFTVTHNTTACTITKAIHYLLKDPNFRILFASKTSTNAEGFLKEVKAHFEGNDRLIEIFGEYYDPRKVTKWDNREIEVLPRTSRAKEASITCVGVGGTIVGKHYDAIISDDLIDEENARTKHMREKTKTWAYQTVDPTLEPPSKDVPHRGEHHRLGTRYHFDDLYGHWIANELKEHHQVVPALDEYGRSPWPEKYPPEWFQEKKRRSGLIIFNAQYQCDTEAMKGEIFQYDDCQLIDDTELPGGLRIFMGVDLAISEKESADKFAIVVVGVDSAKNYYVLDYYENQLRFNAQTEKIKQYYRKWDPILALVETNAYQAAQYQVLKDGDRDLRVRGVIQDKDKITRAWKLTPVFEDGRMFFKKHMSLLVEHLVLFPNYETKDLFDALDLAIRASRVRGRRGGTRKEPGVI